MESRCLQAHGRGVPCTHFDESGHRIHIPCSRIMHMSRRLAYKYAAIRDASCLILEYHLTPTTMSVTVNVSSLILSLITITHPTRLSPMPPRKTWKRSNNTSTMSMPPRSNKCMEKDSTSRGMVTGSHSRKRTSHSKRSPRKRPEIHQNILQL